MSETTNTKGSAGYWLGWIAKVVLGIAMLLYLGLHSFNFFMFTFKGDQWIFAILGLFTTSIGFLLWLAVYLWAAEEGLEKAVALIMMFASLLGEFAVAGFDMYMNITGTLATAGFTGADLRNMSYIIAGLALINGLALVAGVAGQQIIDDVTNIKFPTRNKKTNPAPVMVPNASETEDVRQVKPTGRGVNAYTNPVTDRDREIAASIGLGVAPYRSCRSCDALVGLSQTNCPECGAEMSPLSAWKGNGHADPTKAAPNR